jgi:hypothetical protein
MRFTLSDRRGKEKIPSDQLREYDREELVRLLLSFGKKPYTVYGTEIGVVFVFVYDEVKELVEARMSNDPITGEWKMFLAGDAQWRDAVVAWKGELRARRINDIPQPA